VVRGIILLRCVKEWRVFSRTRLTSPAYCAQLHFYNYLDTHDEASLHTLLSCSEILDSWTSAQGDTYEATSLRYRVTDIVSQLYQAAIDGCTETRVSLSKAQSLNRMWA
jgi:hypothetical protein